MNCDKNKEISTAIEHFKLTVIYYGINKRIRTMVVALIIVLPKFYAMKFFYFIFLLPILHACTGSVRYMGQHYPETQKVDVYVTAGSIKNPADTIGMGFYAAKGFTGSNPEKVQALAEAKARKVGADAILMEYYSVVEENASISNTSIRLDTSGRFPQGVITTQKQPIRQSGFNIRFLRYGKQ